MNTTAELSMDFLISDRFRNPFVSVEENELRLIVEPILPQLNRQESMIRVLYWHRKFGTTEAIMGIYCRMGIWNWKGTCG